MRSSSSRCGSRRMAVLLVTLLTPCLVRAQIVPLDGLEARFTVVHRDRQPLLQHVFEQVLEMPREKLCTMLCQSRPQCMAYNFNRVLGACQLLATDTTLNFRSSGLTNPMSGWVHRGFGPVSRSCPAGEVDTRHCSLIWTQEVALYHMAVSWTAPFDDARGTYLMSDQTVVLYRDQQEGQTTTFPARREARVLPPTQRKSNFAPLIPGAMFNFTVRQYYMAEHQMQSPLVHRESTPPARVIEVRALRAVGEHHVSIAWTLEGVAGLYEVRVSPAEAGAACNPRCMLGVKSSTHTLDGLVAGKAYQFSFVTHSYGKTSAPLTIDQPTYTDVITTSRTDASMRAVMLSFSTESGVGSEHEAVIFAVLTGNIVPQRQTKPFALRQSFTFMNLMPGDMYQVNVAARSQGAPVMVREYSYLESCQPARPSLRSFDSTTTMIYFTIYVEGVYSEVYVSVTPADVHERISPANTNRFEMTGLVPGRMYTVRVRAFSHGKFGPALYFDRATYPSAPSRIVISDINCNSIRYTVYAGPGDGAHFSVFANGHHLGNPGFAGSASNTFGPLGSGMLHTLHATVSNHGLTSASSPSAQCVSMPKVYGATFCAHNSDGTSRTNSLVVRGQNGATCSTAHWRPGRGRSCVGVNCNGACLGPPQYISFQTCYDYFKFWFFVWIEIPNTWSCGHMEFQYGGYTKNLGVNRQVHKGCSHFP